MSRDDSLSSTTVLRQFYFLRNITIIFVTLMALLAFFGLGIQLPLIPLSTILLIMAVTNLITRFNLDSPRAASDPMIFTQLMVEILSFSLILYFSGGATNPFTFFYLIPLAISATLIPGKLTWLLTLLTLIIYSLLLEFFVPLTYETHDHQAMMQMQAGSQFNQHVIGMWFGFMVSALLVTWFITYLSSELKRRNAAINQARQRELRDQQLVMLGALAAGTAHELGTPLASLAIVAGEITDGYDQQQHPDLFDYREILLQQIGRCKQILSVLSESAGSARADAGRLVGAAEFVQMALDHWINQSTNPRYQVHSDPGLGNGVGLLNDVTLLQSITNLMNNAQQACDQPIEVFVAQQRLRLQIRIIDQGPGLSSEQLQAAGQHGFSTKPDGMGIGLFLALNTIQRVGGQVGFEPAKKGGTITLIELPLMEQKPV